MRRLNLEILLLPEFEGGHRLLNVNYCEGSIESPRSPVGWSSVLSQKASTLNVACFSPIGWTLKRFTHFLAPVLFGESWELIGAESSPSIQGAWGKNKVWNYLRKRRASICTVKICYMF